MRNDEMYLQLYIVRHAESMGNICENGDFDKVNPPLSVHGEKQAVLLGERFKKLENFTLYASPLLRAQKTAEAISADIKTNVELLECGIKITGDTFEEYDEYYDACFLRAKKVITDLCGQYSNHANVIIVTHGEFAQFLIKAALGIENKMRLAVYNTAVTKINFSKDYLPKLALHNDISHLKTIDGEKLFWM